MILMANMTVIAAENWANFTSGDILGSVIQTQTNIAGIWFYALIMLMTMTMIQMKSQNFGVTTIIGILISAAIIPFMPENTFFIIIIMIALGIALILYKLFK